MTKDRPPSVATTPEGGADAVFAVGVRAFPYLADHGFQDMLVLPGSFYIDAALAMHGERFARASGTVRNATFDSPVIVSDEDTPVAVRVAHRGTFVEYVFHEGVASAAGGSSPGPPAARLEIHPVAATSPETRIDTWSVEAFQAAAPAALDATEFYEALLVNGNWYGPDFRHLSAIWRDGDRAVGSVTMPAQETESELRSCRPLLLDVATQLLSVFTLDKGRTFVLRSIERVEILDLPYPDRLWALATWRPDPDSGGPVGHVRLVDSAGVPFFELHGVRLTLLPRPNPAPGRAPATLAVAASFTAEPLADSLNFWADRFAAPIAPVFAPYNQIFQQLLSPGSAFRQNADGANAILLSLEHWADSRFPVMRVSDERARECFGNRPRRVLPNGLDIVHLNDYETDYVYKEIFEDHCYARHGIRLPDNATVIDIGANIGLFSLFVCSRSANPRIFAFEPSPVVYDLLRANCSAYASDARVFNLGVAAAAGTAAFTFYGKSSVFSGFHTDASQDRKAIEAVIRNVLTSDAAVAPDEADAYVGELAADRLDAATFQCRLTSVSDIIRDQDIAAVDLLKIDAEKSELDILAGIDERDWPRIRQIVMEIHDPTREKVNDVERLLMAKGYSCVIDQEPSLAHSGLFSLFAVRGGVAGDHGTAAPLDDKDRRTGNLERHAADFAGALRAFMLHSKVPLILAFCPPSSPSGADPPLRSALDAAEERLTAEVARIAEVHTIGSRSLLARYQLDDCFDPDSNRLAHIPFTPEGYAAIGTALFRVMFNLRQAPYKVIVLDCDNTLWKGLCGEDGPLGIEVTPPYRALQEFMVAQVRAGRLLCLCSKNNERDVLGVFRQRTDMVLKEEHLVSRRINWSDKAENVKSLARELSLGLESLIFLDDNPVECATVGINCPGVLTLRMPANADAIPAFLDNIWAFDSPPSTAEGRDRTRMYRQNIAREQSGAQLSLKDFIEGLDLRVSMTEPQAAQIGRVSELTFRTNQFNFTTVRRSELEVRDFLARDGGRGLTACVSDRFGDYGLVGVVLYEERADCYCVETFLLSCRALGKGVEHAIVAAVAQRAVSAGKSLVEFRFAPTATNAPAGEFLRSIARVRRDAAGDSWVFAAGDLAGLEYHPDSASIERHPRTSSSEEPDVPPSSTRRLHDLSAHMQGLGEEFAGIAAITHAVEEHRFRARTTERASVAAAGTLEAALADIWQRALGVPHIGLHDKFFEAGGTSLNAVRVISTIEKELKHHLSIVHLFECPTVSMLAAKLRPPCEVAAAEVSASAGAALRGRQRRYSAARRQSS